MTSRKPNLNEYSNTEATPNGVDSGVVDDLNQPNAEPTRQLLSYVPGQNMAVIGQPGAEYTDEQAEEITTDILIQRAFSELMEGAPEERKGIIMQVVQLIAEGKFEEIQTLFAEAEQAEELEIEAFAEEIQHPVIDDSDGDISEPKESKKSSDQIVKRSFVNRAIVKGRNLLSGLLMMGSVLVAHNASNAGATSSKIVAPKTVDAILPEKSKHTLNILFARDFLIKLQGIINKKSKNQRVVVQNLQKRVKTDSDLSKGGSKVQKVAATFMSVSAGAAGGIKIDGQTFTIEALRKLQDAFHKLLYVDLKDRCRVSTPSASLIKSNTRELNAYLSLKKQVKVLTKKLANQKRLMRKAYTDEEELRKEATKLNSGRKIKKAKLKSADLKKNEGNKHFTDSQKTRVERRKKVKAKKAQLLKVYDLLIRQYKDIHGECKNDVNKSSINKDIENLSTFLDLVSRQKVNHYLEGFEKESNIGDQRADNLGEVIYLMGAKHYFDEQTKKLLESQLVKVNNKHKGLALMRINDKGDFYIVHTDGKGNYKEKKSDQLKKIKKGYTLYAVPAEMQSFFTNPRLFDRLLPNFKEKGGQYPELQTGGYLRGSWLTNHYNNAGKQRGQAMQESGAGISLTAGGSRPLVLGESPTDRNIVSLYWSMGIEMGVMRRQLENVLNPNFRIPDQFNFDFRLMAKLGLNIKDWAGISALIEFDPLNLRGSFGGELNLTMAYVEAYFRVIGTIGSGGAHINSMPLKTKSTGVSGGTIQAGARVRF